MPGTPFGETPSLWHPSPSQRRESLDQVLDWDARAAPLRDLLQGVPHLLLRHASGAVKVLVPNAVALRPKVRAQGPSA